MPVLLKLDIAGARPLRHGSEWFWSVMMERTVHGGAVTVADIEGASDPYQLTAIRLFLKRMTMAGFVGRSDTVPYRYTILKRQQSCPLVSGNGSVSTVGLGQQYMWNVMRRSSQGFTLADLVIGATTDEVAVSQGSAKKYVNLLQGAGILRHLKTITSGRPGRKINVYLLPASQNTGPKAPRIHKSTLVYDPNLQAIKGEVLAEEDRS